MVEATYYLHTDVNVVHRDIKLDNILLEEGTRMVKLIDFGFSVLVTDPRQRLKVFCGGAPVDMWAIGVLLYVMLTGAFPFRGTSE